MTTEGCDNTAVYDTAVDRRWRVSQSVSQFLATDRSSLPSDFVVPPPRLVVVARNRHSFCCLPATGTSGTSAAHSRISEVCKPRRVVVLLLSLSLSLSPFPPALPALARAQAGDASEREARGRPGRRHSGLRGARSDQDEQPAQQAGPCHAGAHAQWPPRSPPHYHHNHGHLAHNHGHLPNVLWTALSSWPSSSHVPHPLQRQLAWRCTYGRAWPALRPSLWYKLSCLSSLTASLTCTESLTTLTPAPCSKPNLRAQP